MFPTDEAKANLPWLILLSPEDREECVRELGEVASAEHAAGYQGRREDTLYQWRATALAAWDEQRLRERGNADVYTRDEPVAIPRPGR